MANNSHIEITPELEVAFWRNVAQSGPDDCWLWTDAKMSGGYGRFRHQGRYLVATHLSLAIDGRQRPDKLLALHACDNPPCVNPAHLRWGTSADNMADIMARRRHPIHTNPGYMRCSDEDMAFRTARARETRIHRASLGLTAMN